MTRDKDDVDDLADAAADGSQAEWQSRLRSVSDEEGRRLIEQYEIIDALATTPDDLPLTLAKLEDFEIEREIGRGGMGRVYEARQISLDRRVALKVLLPELTGSELRLKRFEREAKALGALNHPNIVTIYSVEQVENLHLLNMELVSGETLDKLFGRRRLSLQEFLDLAIPLADALSAAHENGITHRDLKPHNIMVGDDGRVKILDFGLAKLRTEASSTEQDSKANALLTREGSLLGTLPYMSPEQVEGRPVDHRSDLFSLGVVLYETMTGRRPFDGETTAALASSILREEPPPVSVENSSMPPEIDRIIAHCLRKKPDDRYQTAKGLRNELRELRTVSVERPYALLSPRRRRLPVWGVAVVALLVVLAVVGVRMMLPRQPPTWTPSRLTSEAVLESEPALSPDGREVAFVSDRAGNSDIWLVDSTGGNQLRLTTDSSTDRSPTWSPDGRNLLFVSDRTGDDAIWKIARLGGPSVLLMPEAVDPAISPDGRRIAFATIGESGYRRIAVASLDAPSEFTVLTDGQQGLWDHVEPTWSPDGETICYADFRDLWTVPSNGGEVTRLTDEHETDFGPVWSPHGDFIYFSSMRENTLAIWRVPSEGGAAVRLTQGTGPEVEPSLSADGRRLAHSTSAGPANIWVLDRTTGERWRIPGIRTDDLPSFSPDGDRIVFVSDRRGEFDLWIQRLVDGHPDGRPEQLTDQPGSEPLPAFSPDGRWIAYGRVLRQQRDVWIGDARGGPPSQLTLHPGVDIQPAWSPGGESLAIVSDRSGSDDLWIVPVREGAADGEFERITHGEVKVNLPVWAPGGRQIAFVGTVGNETSVWVVELDGDRELRRVAGPAGPRFVRWGPTGETLLVSATDDSETVRLFEVFLESDAVLTVEPPVVFGDESAAGAFDLSKDGNWIAYTQENVESELWILTVKRGRF